MGVIKHSRHQTNGKKTVHSVGTLNHTQHINILHSFATVLAHGLRPQLVGELILVAEVAEIATYFVPP